MGNEDDRLVEAKAVCVFYGNDLMDSPWRSMSLDSWFTVVVIDGF